MITKETVRGKYPVLPLGEVVDFLDHMRRPVKQSDRVEGLYPYYGANGLQGSINGFIFDEPLVLVAEDGGHFDEPKRGIAYQISGKSWVNNHAHVLRPKATVDIRFLTRVLENYDIRPFISGTTRGKLTKGQAERIEIPLPPLEEQKRIAAILDQADALRRLRARALDRLNALGQAIFHEMFGEPSGNWEYTTLEGLVYRDDRINYGVIQPGDHDPDGVPIIRVADLTSSATDPSQLKRISPEIDSEYSRSRLKGGEILIGCVGSIGSTLIVPKTFVGANIARAVARVPVDSKRCNPVYLNSFLRTERVQNFFVKEVRLVAQPTLNIKQIRETEVLLAPRELQDEFANRLSEIDQIKSDMMRSFAASKTTFSSLQHRAFRGEL